MSNELATTSTALTAIMDTSVEDIKTKDQAKECFQYGVLAGKVSSHLKRVAVTACVDKLGMTRKDTGALLVIGAHQVSNLLSEARAVQMAKPATMGSKGSVMTVPPVENPQQLSQLLPTQRDVKAYAKAPVAVKEQVVDLSNSTPTPNDAIVEKVRSLINEDFEIDSSSLTNAEKDECLEGLHVRVEALTAHAAFNDQACAAAMKEYGYLNQEGFWQDHKPLTIIRNLLPKLSTDERKQLIDLLISPINQ